MIDDAIFYPRPPRRPPPPRDPPLLRIDPPLLLIDPLLRLLEPELLIYPLLLRERLLKFDERERLLKFGDVERILPELRLPLMLRVLRLELLKLDEEREFTFPDLLALAWFTRRATSERL